MNSIVKSALFNPQPNCLHMVAALFHSTPVLDRKRRNFWDTRSTYYSRRSRRMNAKQTLLRNVSGYTDDLFQNWKDDFDGDDPSSSRASWFKKDCSRRSKRKNSAKSGPLHWGKRGFEFCEEDVEIETIFRSAFGGNQFFYWSFTNEENPKWRSSSTYSNNFRRSWNWRYREEEEYESSTDSETSDQNLSSDRVTLGLHASGPLKIEDVKSAYRACALKWHPDRHQGPSKSVAEEKFKHCSAAYESICTKLALN